ncbi:MAG: mechanosensitive ion channel family protein [Christensenellales bacterium]|jgi:small conductance mechanosensitive channel
MKNIWQDIVDFFVINGWKIIAVVAVTILGYLAIRLIIKLLKRIFNRRKVDQIVSSFITSVAQILLIIILVVAVFDIIGISTAPFVAVLGTVGLALALSMQESLSNVASGVVIIVTKPFRKGDYVEIGGIEGSVEKITMLTTELKTFDNKKIVMPNNKVAKTEIINFSIMDIRRIDFKFRTDFNADLTKVKSVIGKAIKDNKMILTEPEPSVRLLEQQESSIQFIVRVWVKTADYWTVYYDLREAVFLAFRNNNIKIPYNILDVNIRSEKQKTE